jgi:protein SCO1/2
VRSTRRRRVGPKRSILATVLIVASAPLLACGSSDDAATTDPGADTARAGSGDGRTDEAPPFSGYTIEPAPDVSAVVVPKADGSGEVAMAAPAGGLHLVYFGYTACPDVCPTTMSDLRRALSTLEQSERSQVAVSMVTIDPARDQGAGFANYVSRFIADGAALRTDDPAALRGAADAFGADYEVTTNDEGEVEVSHTGELYAVNDQGQVVLRWPFGTDHESLARDLQSLLAVSGHPDPSGA